MKKKITKYMAFVFSILIIVLAVIGYYMKKDLAKEKEIKAEIEKYNKYAAFYNQSNPAILGDFGEYYFDTFTENRKKLKKLNRVDLLKLNSMRQKLNSLDEPLSKIETVISSKPEFKNIDNYIKEYIEALKEEKKLDLEILDYYENGVYKEDNYEGAVFLQSAYLNALRKSNEKYGVYVEVMKVLIKNQKEKEMERLEKKGKKAAISLVTFIDNTEEFSQILFSRKQFDFSKMEVLKLRGLIEEMKKGYQDLEAISDKQIKKEKYSLESYNKIRSYSKEVVNLSERIMESKRNGDDIYPLLYDFSENYRKIVSEYNKMIGNKK